MKSLASQIIVDILNNEMQMPKNSVWLREQNKTIPNDNNLYIAVGLNSAQTIANVTEIQTLDADGNILPKDDPSGTQYEVNQLTQAEAIQIDVLSSAKSNLALFRQWEVIAAMQSIYAQQQQEANYFKIFRIPRSFIDTSSAEGGSMLQRFTITIVCHVWYRKQKKLGDYYDDFKVTVDNEKTIQNPPPAIEFEVNSSTQKPPYP